MLSLMLIKILQRTISQSVDGGRGEQGAREASQKDTMSSIDVFWGVKNCPDFFRIQSFEINPGGSIW